VRKWTQKLSADANLHVEHKVLLGQNKTYSRQWNIVQLENTSHIVMPVERRMPIAEAEIIFHWYV